MVAARRHHNCALDQSCCFEFYNSRTMAQKQPKGLRLCRTRSEYSSVFICPFISIYIYIYIYICIICMHTIYKYIYVCCKYDGTRQDHQGTSWVELCCLFELMGGSLPMGNLSVRMALRTCSVNCRIGAESVVDIWMEHKDACARPQTCASLVCAPL